MTDEQWLPIPGFEGSYEVSDRGRVRSLDRRVVGLRKQGQRPFFKGRVLRDARMSLQGRLSSHRMVALSVDNCRSHHTVHSLVMLAFVGPRPEGMQICHNNGDGEDNRLSNLRYGTSSENTHDMVLHGVHNNARKTHCKRGHEFDEANTMIIKGGWRQCRACTRATGREGAKRRRRQAAESGGA